MNPPLPSPPKPSIQTHPKGVRWGKWITTMKQYIRIITRKQNKKTTLERS